MSAEIEINYVFVFMLLFNTIVFSDVPLGNFS